MLPRQTRTTLFVGGFTALILATMATPQARADLLTQLGDAANFGILANPGTHNFSLTSDSFVNGTVGVVSSDGTTTGSNNNIMLGNANIMGALDLNGINTNGIGGKVNGSTTNFSQQVADVATAYNTASTLSSNLGLESGFGITAASIAAGTTITASDGTLDAAGNRVFTVDATGGNLNVGALTISGTAGQQVVVNILASNKNISFTKAISLSGALTSNDVLFNIVGTGGQVGAAANNAVLNGTFLAINDKNVWNSVVIDGRLIGGGGLDFQYVSNATLNQPAAGPTVPEPSTLVGAAVGAVAMALVGLRRRRLSAARTA